MKFGQVLLSSGQVRGRVFLFNLTSKKPIKIESYMKLVRLVKSIQHRERLREETRFLSLFFAVGLVRSSQKQNMTTPHKNLTSWVSKEGSS